MILAKSRQLILADFFSFNTQGYISAMVIVIADMYRQKKWNLFSDQQLHCNRNLKALDSFFTEWITQTSEFLNNLYNSSSASVHCISQPQSKVRTVK